ncbi:MAG: hypothetical protein FJ161_00945 [Gammaproteobacteria bacterium]|nr:hypothetical protein [Gammaproteobacteria bacterium]
MQKDLSNYAEEAYREYAMYVLLDRALPKYSDGLKPVQRRLLYTMHELGLAPDAKPKKAVRVVGDTLGKYHPHSDVACYEALVGLAQDFSTRYPLVQGQGNFGSIDDPKSFAAMRYTEARLSRYSRTLMDELTQESVSWQKNFDGTTQEPCELPAQLPTLLLNGCSGIAVGLTSEIPPHNLAECINTVLYAIDHPTANNRQLLLQLKGPDFPSGGILYATEDELLMFYESGKGSFRLTGVIVQEKSDLIISAIPYMSTGSRIIEQIHELIDQKILPQSCTIVDESDEQYPVRIVLRFKNSTQAEESKDILLEKTDLKIQYRCYFHAIDVHGKPTCYSLKEFLNQWVEMRLNCLKAQYIARREEIAKRRAVLKVYHIACESRSTIFHALEHEEDPWGALKNFLQLTDREAEVLSQIRLRELTRLSADTLNAEEQNLLREDRKLLQKIDDRAQCILALKEQLISLKDIYADVRRTQIISEPVEKTAGVKTTKRNTAQSERKADIKECTVIITELGWVKNITSKSQDKIEDWSAHIRPGDRLRQAVRVFSDAELVCFDQKGRLYGCAVEDLPISKFGEHCSALFSIPSGHEMISICSKAQNIILVNSSGYGFQMDLSSITVQKRGKQAVSLDDNESIAAIIPANVSYILAHSKEKFGLLPVEQIAVRQSGKGTLLWKSAGAHKVDIMPFKENDKLFFVSAAGRKSSVTLDDALIKRAQALKMIKKNCELLVIHEEEKTL